MEKNLFAAINDLKKNYPNSWEDKEQFNVFTALRPISDEVYLHSRFIATMLDPTGLHNLGTKPLEIFLELIGSDFKVSDSTIVTPNASNWTEEGDIDILIEDTVKDFAIIIENKIYSGDNNSDPQCGQLQKYFWQVQNAKLRKKGEDARDRENHHKYDPKNIEIYYLTPDRHPASSYSMSHGKEKEGFVDLTNRVKCIGYGEGEVITEWLKKLLKEDNCCEFAKEAIRQYLEVIKEIVGDVELNKKLTQIVCGHIEEVKQFGGLENIGLEHKAKDVKWHIISDFLNELEASLRQNCLKIQDREVPLHMVVTDLIFHPSKHTPLYFRIEKDGVYYTLQADDRCREKGFFFGVDKNQKGLSFNIQENQDEGWYFRIYYPGESLNLSNFTLDLLSKDKRQEIAKQYAEFVKQELAKV
ncbi:MAG: PD-(D/E)XK nuclease family protein [Paludibacteraceae bacterium]|nr:PD-(D/E)XK nuclease family protein [Paludibacteraceae bacterium]